MNYRCRLTLAQENVPATPHSHSIVPAWLRVGCLCALLFGTAPLAAFGATLVLYPRPESQRDARASYPVALLTLCLDKAGGDYQLRPSELHMQQGRSLRFLEQGKYIDIVWTVTSEEREQAFLPIRIPIDRGLIGWRLLLIQQKNRAAFAAVTSKDALAALRAGQGHDWPDTEVLRQNHFEVATSTSYDALFNMLALGHIAYFPRSVAEVWPEVDARPTLGLEVEQSLVIHYPEALYFFVNRRNTALASAVEKGLRAAIADGSMDALFAQYHGDAIRRAKLMARRVITMPNPLLPASARPADRALWFAPADAGTALP
jgi:hypothetical protein